MSLLGVHPKNGVMPLDVVDNLVSLRRWVAEQPDAGLLQRINVFLRDAETARRLQSLVSQLHDSPGVGEKKEGKEGESPPVTFPEHAKELERVEAATADNKLKDLVADLKRSCAYGDAWPICGRGRGIVERLVRLLGAGPRDNPNAQVVFALVNQDKIVRGLSSEFMELARNGNASLHTESRVTANDARRSLDCALAIFHHPEQVRRIPGQHVADRSGLGAKPVPQTQSG